MDLDGDGTRDIISGSYMPGDIFCFRGLGKGQYAPGVKLTGADGKPARAGLASAVAVTDWNGDGKLDLVVGNIHGVVSLLPQVGKKDGLPVFGPAVEVLASDTTSHTSGSTTWTQSRGDAGPLVADWDGDGVEDLLVGYDDGSVRWSKATRDAQGRVVLAKAVELIPSRDEARFLTSAIEEKTGATPSRPQERAKLALADWNGDGKQDLLVGDFSSATGPEPALTAEQSAERRKLESERTDLQRKYDEAWRRADRAARKSLGLPETMSFDEGDETTSRVYEVIGKDAEYKRVREAVDENWKKLAPLTAPHLTHGYVWVHLRKAEAGAK